MSVLGAPGNDHLMRMLSKLDRATSYKILEEFENMHNKSRANPGPLHGIGSVYGGGFPGTESAAIKNEDSSPKQHQ